MRRTKKEIMAGIQDVERSRLIANNTVEYCRVDGSRVIRLHLTDIITYHYSGCIILNSGGWQTVTTKERLNRYGFRVWQIDSVWYLRVGGTSYVWRDGITVYPSGRVVGDGGNVEKLKALDKQIKNYANGFVKALVDGKIEKPGAGDCWDCSFVSDNGRSMGDMSNSNHILSHIEEGYHVPSLLVNALKEFGASRYLQSWVGGLLGYHGHSVSDMDGYAQKQLKGYIVRHCRRRLGMAA
jgi:hypothetical protein